MRTLGLLMTAACLSAGGLAGADPIRVELPVETAFFPPAAYSDMANARCLVCHSMDYVATQPPMGAAFWKAEIEKMQSKYGAELSKEEVQPLTEYLTRQFGKTEAGAETTNVPPTEQQTAGPRSAPVLLAKYGCSSCHQPAFKLIGPAWRNISAKYRDNPSAFQEIARQIEHGGSGKWGPVPMPPFPGVTEAEQRELATWILSQR